MLNYISKVCSKIKNYTVLMRNRNEIKMILDYVYTYEFVDKILKGFYFY